MRKPPDEKRRPGGGGVRDHSRQGTDLEGQYTGQPDHATTVDRMIADAQRGAEFAFRAERRAIDAYEAYRGCTLAEKQHSALLSNRRWCAHRDRLDAEFEREFAQFSALLTAMDIAVGDLWI